MFNVVLYEPEIPDNAGAVGRTCVAVGAKLFLVQPLGFQINHRRIARAGMDYWQYLDYQVVADWSELRLKLSGRYWYFTKRGSVLYSDVCYEAGDVFVFGCESRGLPDNILANMPPENQIRIPTKPEARSLNLSVSVAVTLYEAQRQLEKQ
ncbi:MAG: tRNA (cytidine(34)-2'-O)-methyltransferase [Planctomycetaceae bacterium]|jgi:tRNA (cytidine/uridine-2'-O-)-methyltransferase|nr:tRNA (cytidine(34)-2'-O)-methyltransferase [Planctomycetaceae bacterium]